MSHRVRTDRTGRLKTPIATTEKMASELLSRLLKGHSAPESASDEAQAKQSYPPHSCPSRPAVQEAYLSSLNCGPALGLHQGQSAIQPLSNLGFKTRPRTPEAGMAQSLTNVAKTINKNKCALIQKAYSHSFSLPRPRVPSGQCPFHPCAFLLSWGHLPASREKQPGRQQ